MRRATIEDGPALARLRWEFSDEPRDDFLHFSESFVTFAVAENRWVAWIADAGDRILSNIWVYRVPKVPRPHKHADAYGYLTNVYTVPEARHDGIGSALMSHVIDWARAEKLEALYVSPSEYSIRFYERAGFVWSKEWMAMEIEGYQ